MENQNNKNKKDAELFRACPRCFTLLPLASLLNPVCRVCHDELKGTHNGK
jgi:hypothetical protein